MDTITDYFLNKDSKRHENMENEAKDMRIVCNNVEGMTKNLTKKQTEGADGWRVA